MRLLDKLKNWLDGWIKHEKLKQAYLKIIESKIDLMDKYDKLIQEHNELQEKVIKRYERQEKDLKVAIALTKYFKISYDKALEIYEAAEGTEATK